jgi:hypothetical protein
MVSRARRVPAVPGFRACRGFASSPCDGPGTGRRTHPSVTGSPASSGRLVSAGERGTRRARNQHAGPEQGRSRSESLRARARNHSAISNLRANSPTSGEYSSQSALPVPSACSPAGWRRPRSANNRRRCTRSVAGSTWWAGRPLCEKGFHYVGCIPTMRKMVSSARRSRPLRLSPSGFPDLLRDLGDLWSAGGRNSPRSRSRPRVAVDKSRES